jgi:hypothetical protein
MHRPPVQTASSIQGWEPSPAFLPGCIQRPARIQHEDEDQELVPISINRIEIPLMTLSKKLSDFGRAHLQPLVAPLHWTGQVVHLPFHQRSVAGPVWLGSGWAVRGVAAWREGDLFQRGMQGSRWQAGSYVDLHRLCGSPGSAT